MLITHKEYDQLFKINPQFMDTAWIKLRRQWKIDGIHVSLVLDEDEGVIRVLNRMLEIIRT